VYVALKNVFAQVIKLTADLGVLLEDKKADDETVVTMYESQSKILSGHLKTGQWWSGQNRPMDRRRET
jgi:hypothetical protein